jgi:hypothetical protein
MRQYGRGGMIPASALGKAAVFLGAAAGAAGIAALIGYVSFGSNLFALGRPRPAIHPDNELVTILLRTTVVAVHQANVTGNYTVLRDLAAPAFQEKNSAADLALAFAPLRQQKLDLTPVVLLEPNFTQKPVIDGQNMLRLVGTTQSKPVPVAYELAFQTVSGSWRWSAIAIRSVPQPAAPPPPAPPSAAVQDRSPER